MSTSTALMNNQLLHWLNEPVLFLCEFNSYNFIHHKIFKLLEEHAEYTPLIQPCKKDETLNINHERRKHNPS